MFPKLKKIWYILILTFCKDILAGSDAENQNHAGYIGPLNDSLFHTVCPKLGNYVHQKHTASSCLSLCDMHQGCTAAELDDDNYCELLQCPYPIPKPTRADIGYTSYYKESGYVGPTELIWGEDVCHPFVTFSNATSYLSCFLKCTEQPKCSAVAYGSTGKTCTLMKCPFPIPEPTRKFTSYVGFYKQPGYFGPLTNHWSPPECRTIDYDYTTKSVEECKERCDNKPGCTAINFSLGLHEEFIECTMKKCALPVPQPTENKQYTVGYYKYPGCLPNEFECDNGACIRGMYKCDSIEHCDDGSDENYCVCDKHQFECANTVCIAKQLLCDGNDDCADGSDEKHCACPITKFECDNSVCIDEMMICNGNDDCGDGSDEKDCRCPANEFHCRNGNCIKSYMQCDGNDDCGDYSDERNCACDKNRGLCSNGVCIKKNMICNGRDDCGDGSDEENCSCDVGLFQCSIGICVRKHQLCDGNDDCGDDSDEKHCGGCNPKSFTCRKYKTCISQHKICDNKYDCLDGSDEGDVCHGRPSWCGKNFQWFRNACFRLFDYTSIWIQAENTCRLSDARLLLQKDLDALISLREYINRYVQVSSYELWIGKGSRNQRFNCPYVTKYSVDEGYCKIPRRFACLMEG